MRKAYQDRIDDFLLNRMTKEEIHAFENEIGINLELQEQLKFAKIIQQIMENKNEKKNNEHGLLSLFSDITNVINQ